jgi:type I restriction enzyme, S subunit
MLVRAAAGTSKTMVKLSMSRLRRIKIPLPTLGAQRRAVYLNERLRRLSEALTSLGIAKRALKRGLMQQLLDGRRRFPQFAGSELKTVTLGDVLEYSPRKVPKPMGTFLSAGVRSHGKGVFLKEDFPADGIALEELFVLRDLDLVVNITFGWEGAIAIVPPNADGALVSHRFPTYQFDRTKALPEYFRHLIQTRRFVFDVACASPGGAGRNRVLNRKEFLEILVTLPSPAEQQAIASFLDGLDREIELLERLHQAVGLQNRALLSRLLSGEISVSA